MLALLIHGPPGPRPGAAALLDAWCEGLLGASALTVALALGYLIWKRRDLSLNLAAGPLTLALVIFALMHGAQALSPGHPAPPLKCVAAVAGVAAAASTLWLLPKLLGAPSLEQVRAVHEAKVRVLEEHLEASHEAHSADLRESEASLQSKKLESLGTLAGGLAHDFNNLLGAMAGNVELALLELPPGHPALDYLNVLDDLVNRSSQLVQQILAYSGRGDAQVKALDLNQLAGEIVHVMRASLARRAELRFEPEPGLPPMKGDLVQLQQGIAQLILNGAEAMPEPGVITVRTGSTNLDAQTIREQAHGPQPAPGPMVFLEVADTGPGMSAEVLERIFDPFFTTKTQGRGLGLSAVHGIVREHQGLIQVCSEPASGTCFRLSFPVTQDRPEPRHPAAAPFPATLPKDLGGGAVLVVDDEDPLRIMAVKVLRRFGFTTLEARDGLEALQVFEAHREEIRLVLMDLTMPGMGGEEAYRVLRRSGVLVPVILSSGFSEVDVLQHFSGKGIAGFLQKPYRLQTLSAMVRLALAGEEEGAGWRRIREPLAWDPDMETGHPVLDRQHLALLGVYNRLLAAVARQAPAAIQVKAFLALQEAALAHFGMEDGLMERMGYPRQREHQALHTRLIAQVADLARRIQAGELTFTGPVLDFLEGWLVHHMQEEDALLARYLRAEGH